MNHLGNGGADLPGTVFCGIAIIDPQWLITHPAHVCHDLGRHFRCDVGVRRDKEVASPDIDVIAKADRDCIAGNRVIDVDTTTGDPGHDTAKPRGQQYDFIANA